MTAPFAVCGTASGTVSVTRSRWTGLMIGYTPHAAVPAAR